MLKTLTVGALAAVAFVAAVPAMAATYQYVDMNGNLKTETADNATMAMTQPTDIAAHSGVMLIEDTSDKLPASTDVPL